MVAVCWEDNPEDLLQRLEEIHRGDQPWEKFQERHPETISIGKRERGARDWKKSIEEISPREWEKFQERHPETISIGERGAEPG